MKASKMGHTAGERMLEVRAPSLTSSEGCAGPAFLGEAPHCFSKPRRRKKYKVSYKVGFAVVSDLWGSAPCAAERLSPPRSMPVPG